MIEIIFKTLQNFCLVLFKPKWCNDVNDGLCIVWGSSGVHREIDMVEQMVLFQDYSSPKYGPLHNYPDIQMSTVEFCNAQNM